MMVHKILYVFVPFNTTISRNEKFVMNLLQKKNPSRCRKGSLYNLNEKLSSSFFFDLSFFTGKISEVVNTGSSNFTTLVKFDFLKCRHV